MNAVAKDKPMLELKEISRLRLQAGRSLKLGIRGQRCLDGGEVVCPHLNPHSEESQEWHESN